MINTIPYETPRMYDVDLENHSESPNKLILTLDLLLHSSMCIMIVFSVKLFCRVFRDMYGLHFQIFLPWFCIHFLIQISGVTILTCLFSYDGLNYLQIKPHKKWWLYSRMFDSKKKLISLLIIHGPIEIWPIDFIPKWIKIKLSQLPWYQS